MSRRRRDDWSPSAVPGIRRVFSRVKHRDLEALRNGEYPPLLGGREAEVHQALVGALDAAQLYWVTGDMAKVALDASVDVPVLNLEAFLPSSSGFMCFSSPLPPVPAALQDLTERNSFLREMATVKGDAPCDGLFWYRSGDVVQIFSLLRTRGLRLPAFQGGVVELASPIATGSGRQVAAGAIAVEQVDDAVARALGAFLQSSAQLMTMPTVAEVRDIDPATGETTGMPATAREPQSPRDVRLIELRPMKYVRIEDPAPSPSARTYRHRWIVRGHWRQQAVGAKRGERRATWIPSYIKGPEGAPLLEADNVMVWRR